MIIEMGVLMSAAESRKSEMSKEDNKYDGPALCVSVTFTSAAGK